MPETKILIIGGGLAGLALAQFLLQHNIPFHLYERDVATSLRSQGYRIRISEDGAGALRSLLPSHLYEQFDLTSAPVIEGGYQLDASTAEASPGRMPSQSGRAWNVDRATIRAVLLTGLESYISFGKRFSHYSLHADSVTANFDDSSTASGTLLIGADGVRSLVRRQLLPDHQVLDTEGRAIFGKTLLSALDTNTPEKVLQGGIGIIRHPQYPSVQLFCDTMRFQQSSTAVPLPEDYLYWVLLLQTKSLPIPDSQLLSLSNTEAAGLASELTKSWHPSLQSIMHNQTPDATSGLSFSMARPPIKPWHTDARVTLMGDAAHPMPPVGGVGANAAWKDAAELAQAIADGGAVEALAAYEQGMCERSNTWLERAVGGISRFLGTPPVEEMKVVDWS